MQPHQISGCNENWPWLTWGSIETVELTQESGHHPGHSHVTVSFRGIMLPAADVLQIAFGWSDFHLHRFRIHGRDYGTNRVGGLGFSHNAQTVRLADFQLGFFAFPHEKV